MNRLADLWSQAAWRANYTKLNAHTHDLEGPLPLTSLRLPAHAKANRALLLLVVLLSAALLYTTTHPASAAVSAAPSFVRPAAY